MIRSATVVLLSLAACGGNGGGNDAPGPDAAVSMACMEATGYQDLTNIEEKIFKFSCVFSGCHNGAATAAGRLDFRSGMAFAHLTNFASALEPTRMLVVPNDPAKSYLLLMIGEIAPADADPPGSAPPANVGLMPQNAGGMLLCPEKRGAIKRWIEAGATDN
jgi:hypothetical protein